MAGSSFGGHQVDIDIAADSSITGATANECLIVGKLLGDLGTNHNLYRVEAFGFSNSPATPDRLHRLRTVLWPVSVGVCVSTV